MDLLCKIWNIFAASGEHAPPVLVLTASKGLATQGCKVLTCASLSDESPRKIYVYMREENHPSGQYFEWYGERVHASLSLI